MIPCMSLIVKYRVLTSPLIYHKKSASIFLFFVIFRIANFMYFL